MGRGKGCALQHDCLGGLRTIQIHLTEDEIAVLDLIASRDLRTRKAQCTLWVLTKLYLTSGPFNREQGPPKPMK